MSLSMPKPKVLVVEDELVVARDIEQQLIEMGYEPVGCADRGEHAVDLVAVLRPDLVLMDIQLAGNCGRLHGRAAHSQPVCLAGGFF
jgi:AmiR/NasT family two-component response regulator